MVLTYSPGKVSDAVDVLHLCPDTQGLAWPVDRHIGIYSQLALCDRIQRCTELSGKELRVSGYGSSEKKMEDG